MIKKLICVLGMFILSYNIFSSIDVNDIMCAFAESAEKKYIEENVIDGSTQYLISKANATLLLCEFEKAGRAEFNFPLALEYTEKAIEALETALGYYGTAREIGQRLGYSTQKVDWFKSFNYDDFAKSNKMNMEIAAKVKGYLSKCDVLGIYQHKMDNLKSILLTLNSIRNELKDNQKPSASIFWKLYQEYAESSLFGNYSTLIGKTILGNCGMQ